ncbi:MAG: lysostaphin resistance A-like protein [Planctomycetaceae bacterium]
MPSDSLPVLILMLAQQPAAGQAAENMKLTTTQMLAGLLVLMLAGLSFTVGIRWFVSILNRRHPVPDAGRGIPRIPPLLTFVALSIILLQLVAVWSASFAPADSIPPGGTGNAAEVEADNVAQDKATPDIPDQESRKQAWVLLIASLVMNLVICIPMVIVLLNVKPPRRVRAAATFSSTGTRAAAAADMQELPDAATAGLRADAKGPDPEPDRGIDPGIDPEIGAGENPVDPGGVEFSEGAGRFSLFEELRIASDVMLAAYFPTMLLRVILVALVQGVTGEEAPSNPLLEMITGGAGGGLLAMIIFLGIVMAPLAEELQFRVVLLGGLLQTTSPRYALALSSVTFALLHGFPDGLALLPLAFALGYAFERRQSYLTVVLVHFLFNSLNLAIAFFAIS